jgi:hypothetical protein
MLSNNVLLRKCINPVCQQEFISFHGAKTCSVECRKFWTAERKRRQRREHPEKQREYVRRWKAANPDKTRAMARQWFARWRAKNLEKSRAKSRRWAAANKERIAASSRAWRARNRQKMREIQRRKYIRRVAAYKLIMQLMPDVEF